MSSKNIYQRGICVSQIKFVFPLPSPIAQSVRTGGRWFNPRLGQYSFQGLMIVIATGFIPLSPLSVVITVVMWESSQWFERILCGVLVKRNQGKHG